MGGLALSTGHSTSISFTMYDVYMDPREKNNLSRKLAQMIRLYDSLYLDHKMLLEQYEQLNDNYKKLAAFKGEQLITKLVKGYPHLFTEEEDVL